MNKWSCPHLPILGNASYDASKILPTPCTLLPWWEVYNFIMQSKHLNMYFIQKYKESPWMQLITFLFQDTRNNVCGNNRNLQVSELHCCLAEFGAYCCDVPECFSAPGLRGIHSLIFQVLKMLSGASCLQDTRMSCKSTCCLSVKACGNVNILFIILQRTHYFL